MYRNYVSPRFKCRHWNVLKLVTRGYLPRRAVLYVPADDKKKVEEATSPKLEVDSIMLDCEDGITATHKTQARVNIRELLDVGKPQKKHTYDLAVRLNSYKKDLERDISTIFTGKHFPDTVVLPKVDTISDLKTFEDLIKEYIKTEVKLQLLLCIESATAILHLESILDYSFKFRIDSRLLPVGVMFHAEGFCASIGTTKSESAIETAYARQKLVVAANSFGFQAIDMSYTKLNDLEGLRKEAEEGAQLGYVGKQVIHTEQISTVQKAFVPSEAKIAWAEGLLKSFDKHQKKGSGTFVYQGRAVDMPMMKQAEHILELTNSIGARDS